MPSSHSYIAVGTAATRYTQLPHGDDGTCLCDKHTLWSSDKFSYQSINPSKSPRLFGVYITIQVRARGLRCERKRRSALPRVSQVP